VVKNFFTLMKDTGMKEQYMIKTLEGNSGLQMNPGKPLDPSWTMLMLFISLGGLNDQSRRAT
jgi:hypothetical protein